MIWIVCTFSWLLLNWLRVYHSYLLFSVQLYLQLFIWKISEKHFSNLFIIDHRTSENQIKCEFCSKSFFIFERSDTRQQLPIVEVIKNDEIESISMKYGIQWINPTETIIKSIDYEQGDSVSFSDQTMSVRELIVKFENDIKEKYLIE